MASSVIQNKSKFVLLMTVILAVPLGISTVTLSSGTIIEQTANDVEIVVESEFNTSELEVYDTATEFGGTNFSIFHDDPGLVQANMTKFNASVPQGELVTDFKANASDGTTMDFKFTNLTENQYFVFRKNSNIVENSSTSSTGNFSTSVSFSSTGFDDFSLEASARDTPSVNVDVNKTEAYNQSEVVGVTGTVVRDSTGDPIEDADITLYRDGVEIATGIQSDADGEFNHSFDTGKEAGEFKLEAEANKSGISGNGSTTYLVDKIFLENADVSGDNFVDADDVANSTLKVYRNTENPIDDVSYRLFDDTDSLLTTNSMENTSARTDTQEYYYELAYWGIGSYNIKFNAQSQLDGNTINEFKQLETNFEVQNISLSINTNRDSYGIGSGDQVDVTGTAILKDNDTPVANEEVNIDVVNKSSGDIINSYTATTDSQGDYSKSFNFIEEEGVRKINSSIVNSNGIDGEAKDEYSVTNMDVYSIGFDDSERLHAYNVTGFLSDSTNFTDPSDYECEFNVSDGEGNIEIYNEGINASYGENDQATCTKPYISSDNNSGWDHLEELTTEITLTKNSVQTSSSSSRALPNNAPGVIEDTDISLEYDSSTFRYTVNATAEDGDIPDENEIDNCYITYIGDQKLSHQVEGTLDKTYGGAEEASCSAKFDPSNSTVDRNELIEARVNFNDTHGGIGRSSMIAGPTPVQAEVRDFREDAVPAEFTILDSNTGEELKVLDTGSDGEIYDYVPRGTHDVTIDALGHEAKLNNVDLESAQDLLLEVDDNLDSSVDKTVVRSEMDKIAYETSGFSYSDAEIDMQYESYNENLVSGWYCSDFNSSVFSLDCSSSFSEPDYTLDADENNLTLRTDALEGGYTLADSSGWKDVWAARKKITVEGTNRDVQNYQIELAVNTSELLINNVIENDCSDLRFYTTSQTQSIDHWMKPNQCGSENAEVWIEMPYIPANSSRTVYMYSGQASLSDASSGTQTFLDFDEFTSSIGSSYSKTGDVSQGSSQLILRSDDGNEASVTYTGTQREAPYRFMTTFNPSKNAENSTVETLISGSEDSIEMDATNNLFRNEYSSTSKSLDLPSDDLDANSTILSNEQSVDLSHTSGTGSATITNTVPDQSAYPFKARILEESGSPEQQSIDRWFTAKYAENIAANIGALDEAWVLKLNGENNDIKVDPGIDVNIEIASDGRNADVTGYVNDQEEFSAQDTQSATFVDNFSDNRYYEIRFEIDGFAKSPQHDVIVGDDNEAPYLNVTGVTQADNAIDIKFDYNDNFLGDVECEAIVDGTIRNTKRVPNTNTDLNRSAEISLSNLDSADSNSQIGVRCKDQTGNSNSEFFDDDVDLEPPTIEIQTPVDGGNQMRVRPRMEINMTDQTTNDIDYTLSYTGSSISKTGSVQNNTMTEIFMKAPNSYGEKTIAVTGTDKNGFSTTKYVTLDITKPYINITSPAPDTSESPVRGSASITISPERIESLTGNETFEYEYVTDAQSTTQCHLEVNGVTYNTTTDSVNQTNQISGYQMSEDYDVPVRVKCDSTAGTNISDEMRISIDRTKPEFQIFETNDWENNTEYRPSKEWGLRLDVTDNFETPKKIECSWYSDRCWVESDRNPYLEINGSYNDIMIRHNFSGSMQNTSISCETEEWSTGDENPTRHVECRDDFIIDSEKISSLSSLDAGNYDYNIWVRDDVGNVRETGTRRLKVEKGTAGVGLSLENDRAQKGYIINGTSPRLRCSAQYQDSDLELDRNGGLIDSSTSGDVTDYSNLNTAGDYSYNCSIGGTGNFNSGYSTSALEVIGWAWNATDGTKNFNDPDSDNYIEAGVNMTLDTPSTTTSPQESFKEGTAFVAPKSNDNWNITYGGVQSINTESRTGNNELYIDGVNVGQSHQESFSTGVYTLKANSSGFPRFLPEGFSKTLRVKEATPALDINSNASFEPEVGEFFKLTCGSSTTQNDMDLYFDGAIKDSGTNTDTVSNTFNASDVGRGTYRTDCVSNSSENYTKENISRTVEIQTRKPDMNFAIDPQDETTSIRSARDIFNNNEDAYAIRPNKEVTVTCNTIQDVGTVLDVDGTDVSKPYTVTYSDLEDHTFTCTSNKTTLFDVKEKQKILSISNVTSTELYLNESRSDITVNQTKAYNMNISAELNMSDNIELWELSDPDYRDSDGFNEYDEHSNPNKTNADYNRHYPAYSGVEGNITDVRLSGFGDGRTGPKQMIPGNYVIHATHPYTDDTYYSSETYTVTVEDSTAPRIEIDLESGELFSGNPEIRANTQDFSAYTCSFYVDGDKKNINVGRGGGFSLDYYSSFSDNQTAWSETADGKLTGKENDRARIAKTAGLDLFDGDHTATVDCQDENGNRRVVDKDFTVDTAPPTVAFSNADGGIQADGTSTPELQVYGSDGVSDQVDTEIFSVEEGSLATKSISGQEGIIISSLNPGNYSIYAEGTDGVGNVGNSTTQHGLVELEIPSTLVYNMSPSSLNVADGPRYVSDRDVNLSFKYAADTTPKDCTVSINESNVNDVTIADVENKTQEGVLVQGLDDGVYGWSASCGSGTETVAKSTSFIVDSTKPAAEWTGVNRDSGKIEQEEEITFAVDPSDNFEVGEVNITADWLSTHPMNCGSDGLCTYETSVPAGEHNYNYTICDEANNCETTNTQDYSVVSPDSAMELQLDGESQNTSLNESPVLNVSSVFSNGVRGDSTFSFSKGETKFTGSGTPLARSTDALSTQFEERFYQNGTYAIRGTFDGVTSEGERVSDTDYLFIDVNLTESDISNFGYLIYNLKKGNASLRNDPGFSPTFPGNGIVDERKVVLGEGLGENLAAQFTAKFNADLNAENISFDTDKASRKSVISFESKYNQISEHSLLVPREEDSGKVLVCPGADTLDEIVLGCTGAVNVTSGETENGISNTETTINGEKYYHIEGISGTGAQELSTDSGIQAPNRANVTDQEVLDEWSRALPAEGDLDLDGGNITKADLYTEQATDHWAGIYGNATGEITLGSNSLFYEWEADPKTVFAANDTVDWNTLQTSTLDDIDSYYGIAGYSDSASDTLNETADFTVGGLDIKDAPSARTYNGTQKPLWITGALSDGTTPVFAGKAWTNESTAFTGEIANYQMIIPTGGDFVVPYRMYMELE